VSASVAWAGVLTIGKLGASRAQLQYYEQQVAAGLEDYYAGRGEAPGLWRGADALGLPAGQQVARDAFMALMAGRSPVDGEVLRPMGACSTVAALDLTFSAPKSVSVLFATADDRLSAALLDAHESAVDEALVYLEREACFTRRGHGGAEPVCGEGLIAASYRHRMSRAGDPQLHTHVVVANLTRADGKYTALDAHVLYEHKSAAGAVYRAVLRAGVRERLGWVSWRAAGRGLFEIDGIPEAVLRHFSQRRVEIEERAIELAGVAAGGLSRERMQGIALATRRAKPYGVDGSGWREEARARAAEHGFGHAELRALQERVVRETVEADRARLAARLSGPEGLTAMHNTFARRHALAEIAGAFAQGATGAELETATSGYLDDPSVLCLSRPEEARYTTLDLLACERQIVDGAGRRSRKAVGRVSSELVDRVLARYEPALNDDQAAAVRAIARSGHGVDVVQALAGTGKTTMIGALAACYEQDAWRVVGAAPTGRAARQLRNVAGVPASTMHALVGELDRSGGFARRTVLVLDEAGMAPTRLTAELLARAESAGVKVVAVGDSGQLPSVQAGGWLAALSRRQPGPELREVIRQRDPEERAALEALHDGEPDRYLAHKQDAITIHASETDALAKLVDQWHAAQDAHGPRGAVMIARDNHTREQLNHAARDRLKRDGALPATGTWVVQHEYAPGDRVIARRNSRYHDVDNGTVGTVIEIDARRHRMRLETDLGDLRELDLAYVTRHVQHAYALTGHGAQGGTVTWAGVIGRPEEFTREWAYTALSRAREHTTLHLIAERSEHQRDRESYAPAEVARDTATTVRALHQAMRRSETEPLALDHLQPADQHLAQPERVLAVRALGLPGERAQQRGYPGPLTPPSRAFGPSNEQRGPSIAR